MKELKKGWLKRALNSAKQEFDQLPKEYQKRIEARMDIEFPIKPRKKRKT